MKKTFVVIILIVLAIGGIFWQIKRAKQSQTGSSNNTPTVLKPAINGAEVAEEKALRRPIAVMIENHSVARPQAGLTDADIVYETLAEGGITRFMALFQSREPKSIGPIRSARPYFNLLADQWGAVLSHSGGSDTALKELNVGLYKNIKDADEYVNGSYYERIDSRAAPHNLYSSNDKLRQLLTDKRWTEWQPINNFVFKTIPTDQLKTEVTEITIPFSTASYLVKYTFEPSTATYVRTNGTAEFKDSNNDQTVHAKNILVQFAEATAIPNDPKLRIDINLENSGKIYLFTGGTVVSGKWANHNGRIDYTDSEGKPLVVQPGQIWIEIVPQALMNSVSWK